MLQFRKFKNKYTKYVQWIQDDDDGVKQERTKEYNTE